MSQAQAHVLWHRCCVCVCMCVYVCVQASLASVLDLMSENRKCTYFPVSVRKAPNTVQRMCVQANIERNVLWYVSGSRAHHGAQHHLEVSFWVDSQAACSRAECGWGGGQQGPAQTCLSLQGQNQREVQPPSGVTGDQPFLTAFLDWCKVS